MLPLRILLLYRLNEPRPYRVAIRHHLEALERYGRASHRFFYYNAVDGVPAWLRGVRFDAVVLHTTFLAMRWSHLFPFWKWDARWLAELDCPKLALPQDEYDHSEVLDEWLYELGATDVFTVFDEDVRPVLYPLMYERARFHRCLTGYADDNTAERLRPRLVRLADRPHDVVYRAAHLPYRFGRQGQLKHRVGDVVQKRAAALGLSADISTRFEDVVLGDAWMDFLMSGRTTIGCESGSSALDRRGELRAGIDALLAEDPTLGFEQVSARLPASWDDHAFFAVSPRHFEAVIAKTGQILVEGRYEGIFEAGRHYIPLRPDLSNLDDALEQARDLALLERLTKQAYDEIYSSGEYSYRRFAALLEEALAAAEPRRRLPGPALDTAWRVAEVAVRLEAAVESRKPRILSRLLESPRSSLTKGLVTMRLTLASPAGRRLLVDYLRDTDSRRSASTHHLLADLLRLGLLRQLRLTGRVVSERPFGVHVSLTDGGRKVFIESLRDGAEPSGPPPARDELVNAFGSGRVKAIVWDHSQVGSSVSVPIAPGRHVFVRVGIGDSHRFEALAALGRRFPSHAADAVASILET